MLRAVAIVTFAAASPPLSLGEYLREHRAADLALVTGHAAEARAGFSRCLELSPENSTVAYGLACAAARSGELEIALQWLETAIEWGYADAEVALWDEDLAGLRAEARFANDVAQMRSRVEKSPERHALVRIVDFDVESYCEDAAIDPTGRFVVVGESAGTLAILDARNGSLLRRSSGLGSSVWAVAIHPSGERVAALTFDGSVYSWLHAGDAPAARIATLDDKEENDIETGWPFGAFLEYGSTGDRLFVAARERGWCLLRDDGGLVRSSASALGHYFAVRAAWSHDAKTIALVQDGSEDTVRFLDAGTGEERPAPLLCPAEVVGLDLSPDGRLLATGHADARLRIWDLERGVVLHEDLYVDPWPFDEDDVPYVRDVRFSPDGRRVAYSTDPCVTVVVLDVQSGKRVAVHETGGGRMGECVPITWGSKGERLWFAYAGGVMEVEELDLRTDPPAVFTTTRGRPPRPSPCGLAAVTHSCGVAVLELGTGKFLWHRANLDAGELLNAPTGHFTCDFDDLSGVHVWDGRSSEDLPLLADHVERLFDPKRVRAARAGVQLVPVDF